MPKEAGSPSGPVFFMGICHLVWFLSGSELRGGQMDFGDISERGLVLLGCGKMGSAMLEGWLKGGLAPESVWVQDPKPSDWVLAQGVHVNEGLPGAPSIVIVAVKPQMMGDALPAIAALGNGSTVFLSIAAGTTIATFEEVLGGETPVIRVMPNTPAAIGRGISAMIGNDHVAADRLDLAEVLLSAVGKVVRLEGEHQMDAVTAVSGSGPAYVFHLIETLAAAGEAEGLSSELASPHPSDAHLPTAPLCRPPTAKPRPNPGDLRPHDHCRSLR